MPQIKIICDLCGKECTKSSQDIKRTNKNFCSLSCSAKMNNKLYPKRGTGEKKKCLNCDNLIPKYKTYCSLSCNHDYVSNRNYNEIEKNGFSKNVSNPTIRNFLTRKYGNKCMLCGLDASDWNGKQIVLIVDHIDGRANNNDMSNLRIICPNCDSQLDTFKGRNIGKSTRKYYIVQKDSRN